MNRREARAKTQDEGNCKVLVFDEERIARAKASMLDADVVRDVADTFKVLANETRVRILQALAQEELCVCDLSKVLRLSVSATSHQLQVLRRGRIVRYRMAGKLAYYSLRDHFVLDLLDAGVRHVSDGEASG
jgi:DNA-binding transcriptional ArsR family regulator